MDTTAEPTDVFEVDKTVRDWDADYYHPISEAYYDEAIVDVLEALGAGAGDTVLDAGCGPGVHAIRAARRGRRVVAVDISEQMLRHARERAGAAGVAGAIEFVKGDLTRLNLGRTFDHAFSWGVLIHVPDAGDALDRLAAHVSPGGRLALQVLNRDSLDFALERLVRRLVGRPLPAAERTPLGTGNWYAYNDGRLWVMRFDRRALERDMRARGFVLKAVRTAEFSELQRRAGGALRTLLLRFNRLAYRLQLSPRRACTQIFVFEKQAA